MLRPNMTPDDFFNAAMAAEACASEHKGAADRFWFEVAQGNYRADRDYQVAMQAYISAIEIRDHYLSKI